VTSSSFNTATIGEVLRSHPERRLRKISSAHFFKMRRIISRNMGSKVFNKCRSINTTMVFLSVIVYHQVIITYLKLILGQVNKVLKSSRMRKEVKKISLQILTLKIYSSLIFPLRCFHRATLTILQQAKVIHYSINSFWEGSKTVFLYTKD
jgi:hypothetical protein